MVVGAIPSMPKLYVTRHVVSLLGVPEGRLADLVRRGRVSPAPVVVAARRLWTEAQIRQAAAALGIDPSFVGEPEPARPGAEPGLEISMTPPSGVVSGPGLGEDTP